ncbi:MAG: GNAT family N-acetyltransferase [Oscillospiraceae bacterium]|nr:GNAT family N-acetyltransferase [Oscillospiraceae bacterium]
MIIEISLERLSEILEGKKQKSSVLLTRLVSNARCFLPHKLCSLYEIQRKNKTVGLICSYSGNLTAHFFKKPDLNEFISFLNFEGGAARFLEADKRIIDRILKKCDGEAAFGSAFVLKKTPKTPQSDCEIKEENDAHTFFDVLKSANSSYKDTAFESYYCDYFYRKAPPARLFTACLGGKKVGTAAVLHFFEKNAIISDVAVHPDFRRLRLGWRLIFEVCQSLQSEGYTPCLLCTSPSASKLYKKIGFSTESRFGLLLLKEDA